MFTSKEVAYKLVNNGYGHDGAIICIQIKNMKNKTSTKSNLRNLSFYKEDLKWYADLPDFIESGLGNKNNLLMVDGADTLLDIMSNNGSKVQITLSDKSFEGYSTVLEKEKSGLNKRLLETIGHAPVEYGAYYLATIYENRSFHHPLWLCPVTEYVFNGAYPEKIFLKKIS